MWIFSIPASQLRIGDVVTGFNGWGDAPRPSTVTGLGEVTVRGVTRVVASFDTEARPTEMHGWERVTIAPRHPERAWTCPDCKAEPGQPCASPVGNKLTSGGSHAARRMLARQLQAITDYEGSAQ